MLTLRHRLMTAQEIAEYRCVPYRYLGPQALGDAWIDLRLLFIRLYNAEIRQVIRETRELRDSTSQW